MRRKLALLVLFALDAAACRERDAGRAVHAELRPPGVAATPTPPATERDASVELVARHPSGVPLHPTLGAADVSTRLAGGTRVVVEEQSADGRWLRIVAQDGTTGWITRRYARDLAGSPRQQLAPGHDSPWSAPERCQALLAARERTDRRAGSARIGTWNLHWFPDGRPGRSARESGGTDLAWLACTIAWLELDVVAVQEVKTHPRARERVKELVILLDQHTHGRWQLRADDCPNEAGQHVGFLWNDKRVTASAWTTLASLNPQGEACKDQLRPGLAAKFRFVGGLDVMVASVHLKSGQERRSFELRRRSLAGLKSALSELRAAGDDDVLIAGDLNTMGCAGCSPPVSREDELATLGKEVSVPGLRLVQPAHRCSEYFEGTGVLLDHFVAATNMLELPAERPSLVSGICGELGCQALPGHAMPPAHAKLSDHCPVVVDLDDRDLD